MGWRNALAVVLRGLAAAMLLAVVPSVSGEDGTVMRFPIGGKTRFASGLKMEIDTRWVEAQGYRPIRIKLGTVNGAPALADRTVEVRIKPRSRMNSEEQTDEISKFVTLAEGKSETTATVLVLQEALWNQIEVETYEDGFQLLDMSGSFAASSSARRVNQYYGWDQDAITFLVIHSNVPERSKRTAGTSGTTPAVTASLPAANSAAVPNQIPDIRPLALQIPDPVGSYNIYSGNTPVIAVDNDPANALTDAQLMNWLATRSNFEMLPPSEVPLQWMEFTCFDFVLISLDEAKSLAEKSPKRWEAVRKWVEAGGNLVVYGIGDAQKLTEVDRLLEESNPSPLWTLAPTAKNTTSVDFVSETTSRYYNGQEVPKIDINKDKPTTGYFTVQTRRAGLGLVATIQEADVFPGTRRQWTGLINSYPSWRSLWSVRNGVSLTGSNGDSFWQFAIPGFGMAPVMLFVGLITVFVIVLGPLNYSWLLRRKQLSLLIFTVPLGALLTIFSLSAYAILGDGLYTRARIWSVTDLDQRTGRGTSWSHQTYYAGIPPWGGLSFPSDAAVYPVDQLAESMGYNNYSMRRDARRMNWEDGQNLQRGYIASRTLSQFVVVQPIKSEAKLVIKDGQVTNQLGAKIKHLILRGADDEVLYCGALAPGATSNLSSFGKPEQDAVTELFTSAKPQLMEGFDSVAYSSAMTSYDRRMIYYGSARTYTATAEGEGVLMEEFANSESPTEVKRKLAPQTYYAIVEKSPSTPLGSSSAIEVLSLHVIRGRW